MIRNLFLVRPETIQLLSVLLRSLLSFSICLMGCSPAHATLLSFSLCLVGRSAAHQPNARSAQTGVADQLMDAERPMIRQHGTLRVPCFNFLSLSHAISVEFSHRADQAKYIPWQSDRNGDLWSASKQPDKT